MLEGELEKVVRASMAEVKQEKAAQLRRCDYSRGKARRLCRADSYQCFARLLLSVLVSLKTTLTVNTILMSLIVLLVQLYSLSSENLQSAKV